MNNLNSVLIEGEISVEPVYKETPNGTPLCIFEIVSKRYFKNDSGMKEEVSYFEIESWSRLAENVRELGKKGRGVRVVGRMKQERWLDRDRKHQSKVKIVSEHIEFKPGVYHKEKRSSKEENSTF